MRSVRHVPPWLFGITAIPYGVSAGFALVFMPYVLRQHGITLGKIGWFNLATFIPSIFQFVYASAIDFGPPRRAWLVALAFGGSLCLYASLFVPLPSGLST